RSVILVLMAWHLRESIRVAPTTVRPSLFPWQPPAHNLHCRLSVELFSYCCHSRTYPDRPPPRLPTEGFHFRPGSPPTLLAVRSASLDEAQRASPTGIALPPHMTIMCASETQLAQSASWHPVLSAGFSEM